MSVMPAISTWARRWSLGLPAYAINGMGVTLGLGCIQGFTGLLGGPGAALLAAGGAVCTSLADLPNPRSRARLRLVTAALVGCTVSVGVDALRPYPVALGLAIALIGFASTMALAWGPRAGPISFVGILAFIFAMAAPPVHDLAPLLERAGWTALGAALYVLWGLAAATLLQRRYRTLALAAVIGGVAQLLRSRAVLVVQEPRSAEADTPLQDWIRQASVFDERLQAARDLLFDAPESPLARRQTALLLLAIDLRETLLVSELDRELIGYDAQGMRVREAMAAELADMATAFSRMHASLRNAQPWRQPGPAASDLLRTLAEAARFASGDPRAGLTGMLLERARHMRDDLARMHALMQGGAATVQLDRAQLRLFVSVEGWPLAALRPHTHLRSPILRHALRAGVALGSAYAIALALPWAAHPHWLVLSVAVVLRGTLEQTLARRNGRIAGTLLGCGLVLLLSLADQPWLATAAFLLSAGTAHAFVLKRYAVTAAAATVMALLQAHLAAPALGFSVPERLADTLLGAALAWGFSYVLPSWERHSLVRVVTRVRRALAELSALALRWPHDDGAEVALRLARREVHDALGSLAAAAQRTRVEPAHVRLPVYTLAGLLMHSHALLAHLAAVRRLLTRHADVLGAEHAQTAAVLADAATQLQQALAPPPASAAVTEPPAEPIALPPHPAVESPLPWLRRRLQLAMREASRVAHTADAAGARD